nr:MAG TPA: hypothetical protein [Caudoviricetes sp.]
MVLFMIYQRPFSLDYLYVSHLSILMALRESILLINCF